MHDSELYRKYRQLIEGLADERRSTELSLTTLESEAGALEPAAAGFVSDEIADQLEHEALRATSRHRRIVLLAAVKGFDGMSFAGVKT